MDYFDVLKHGLKIAWEHKRLWVLGFFVAGAASVPNPSYTQTMSGPDQPDAAAQIEPLLRWAEANPVLLVVLAAVLVFVGLLLFVLTIAAHGGLVWAVNEAAEGRPARLKDAWGAGFQRWGRTFMIGLSLFLPLVIVFGAVAAVALLPVASAARSSSDAAAAGAFGTICCGLPIALLVAAVSSVLVGLLFNIALRYGVLDDKSFGSAVRAAWNDVWGKRGVWAMWLVMLLPGFGYGAVVGVVGLLLAAPAALAMYSGQVITGVGILFLAGLVLVVPQAAFSTFASSAWTVFYRRMTGREQVQPGVTPVPQTTAPYGSQAGPQQFELPPPPPSRQPDFNPPPPTSAPVRPPAAPEAPSDDGSP